MDVQDMRLRSNLFFYNFSKHFAKNKWTFHLLTGMLI